jgi:hypothetical protein
MRKLFLAALIVMFSLALVNCGSTKLTDDSAKDIFVNKLKDTINDLLDTDKNISDEDKENARQKLNELKDAIQFTDTKESEDGKTGTANLKLAKGESAPTLTLHFAKVSGNWEIKKVKNHGDFMPAEKFFDGMKSSLAKGRIKTTMGDMKNVGSAIESYMVDNYFAPQVSTFAELKDLLVPFHIMILPMTDAWGNEFHYKADELGPNQDNYFIGSGGSDGKFEGFDQAGTYSDSNGKDIIFSNGTFVYFPN